MEGLALNVLELDRKSSYEKGKTVFGHLLYLPGRIGKLEKLGESVFFPKKHVILEGGHISKYCYVVKRGRVVSYETYANGEERIYHFHEEGALFLEENILFGQTTPLSFRTACATELIRIDRNSLMKAIKTDSQLALDLLESASVKFHSSMEQVRHTRNYSISWKISDLLLSFAEYSGVPYGNKVLIKEKISQQMISSMLGINRITAVRAIKELKDLGLVEQVKGFYCVMDMEKLEEYRDSLNKNG